MKPNVSTDSPDLLTKESSKIRNGFVLNPSLTPIYTNHLNVRAFNFFLEFIAHDLGFIHRNYVKLWVARKDHFACTSKAIPSIN